MSVWAERERNCRRGRRSVIGQGGGLVDWKLRDVDDGGGKGGASARAKAREDGGDGQGVW